MTVGVQGSGVGVHVQVEGSGVGIQGSRFKFKVQELEELLCERLLHRLPPDPAWVVIFVFLWVAISILFWVWILIILVGDLYFLFFFERQS